MSGSEHARETEGKQGGSVLAAGVLALTAALSLTWSNVRLMWNDEFLSFYSDSAPSLRRVLEIQLHSPISLDPPTYHLLSHLSMQVIGPTGMALRLPALSGFLLLQLSLFLLLRRIASARAGLIAMTLPLLTASFRYSVEGRPYGLLLGLYAASLLCWYTAADRGGRTPMETLESNRIIPLAGLVISIALAITSHYFGVLILLPVSLAEFARTVSRRRFDWPMVAALAVGFAAIGIVLPFQKALLPYRQHYYTSSVNLHNISQGYREIFVRYNTWPMPLQRVCAGALALASIVLLIAVIRLFLSGFARATEPRRALWNGLWAALLAFAILPFFGYLFGKFVTHTMEVRYVIATLIAFAVALALVLAPLLQSNRFFYCLFAATLILAAVVGTVQIRTEHYISQTILAGLSVPPALSAELAAHPEKRLYTQSLGDFFVDSFYAPNPLLRNRLSLLYDQDAEVYWLRHNTNAVTAVYLQRFAPLSVVPYRQFLAEPGPLLLDYKSGWEWVGKDLQSRHMRHRLLGTALHGELTQVETSNRP